ncbi:MAG: glycoside hydrolase family 27 protein, partial [Acidimicrobiales bacterium]
MLGWSSWSSFRHTSTAAIDEANAQAMVSSGLAAVGYSSINQDDGWYACPKVEYTGATAHPGTTDGPTVNTFGQWVTSQTTTSNTGAFPNEGTENGMEVLGNYIHSLGLKFGIYLTPGISGNAIYRNTPVENNQDGQNDTTPSSYTADEITENYPQGTTLTPADYRGTLVTDNNYNCGGTWEFNYTSPGAQLFVDSEADQFASWGVNFVKLDGITDTNTKDVASWSQALNQTGTPIDLDITEGTFTISIATTLDEYATQWEYSPDIEEGGGRNLTTYQSADIRFNTDAIWQSKGGAGKGFNDDDSVEIGDGCSTLPTSVGTAGEYICPGATAGIHGDDGLTLPAEETVLSLWSLASSPLILGATLQVLHDNPVTLALLTNKQVLAVDQD